MAAVMRNAGSISAILVLYLSLCSVSAGSSNKYYMDTRCGDVLEMGDEGIRWGKLELTRKSKYRPVMNCWLTIRAPANHSVLVSFLDMDIHEFFSCDDYVQIYDGHTSSGRPLTTKLCDDDTPRMSLHSTGSDISVHFVSDNFVEDDGFKLLFTAYHHGACKPDEFKCGNGYCIDKELKCNGYNNCGDNSDACEWTIGSIIGAIAVVGVIVLVVVAVCYFVRRRRRQRGGRVIKTNDPVTVPMTAPVQSYPAAQPAQYPQPAYVPPPQPYVPPPQPYAPPPGQYPPPSAPGYPPTAPTQYPPPQPAQYPPPQGYPPQPPPQGYPSQPPPGYPETATAPPPYQEKPPL